MAATQPTDPRLALVEQILRGQAAPGSGSPSSGSSSASDAAAQLILQQLGVSAGAGQDVADALNRLTAHIDTLVLATLFHDGIPADAVASGRKSLQDWPLGKTRTASPAAGATVTLDFTKVLGRPALSGALDNLGTVDLSLVFIKLNPDGSEDDRSDTPTTLPAGASIDLDGPAWALDVTAPAGGAAGQLQARVR